MAKDHIPSNHPITPPHREEDRLAWLRLLRSRRVGATTFYRLLRECGSASAALAELPAVARAAGVEDYQPCPEGVALAELKAARLAGARMVAFGTPEYPPLLSQIADAPPILWAIGDVQILQRPAIALVGARNASSLGTRMARSLAAGLGEAGWLVVSGLARGIDTAAHVAALKTGTVAVMPGGVDVVYPSENASLAQEIGESGLLLSEHPFGMQPLARHFPMRNRIISGLCQGIVVVEAALKSGSLITARSALDQGREVLAVPGHPFDERASGCNALIRDGATLVRGARDVIEALSDPAARSAMRPGADAAPETEPAARVPSVAPPSSPSSSSRPPARPLQAPPRGNVPPARPARERSLAEMSALHSQILDRLGPSPLAEDQLIRDLGLPAQDLGSELLELELDGRIERRPGGLLARLH